jgi:hypothetical protein
MEDQTFKATENGGDSAGKDKELSRRRSAAVLVANRSPGGMGIPSASTTGQDSSAALSSSLPSDFSGIGMVSPRTEPAVISVHERPDGINSKRLSDQDVSRSEAKYFARYGLDVPDDSPRAQPSANGRQGPRRPPQITADGYAMETPVDGGSGSQVYSYESERLLGGYSVERDYEEEKKCCSCTIV